MTRTKEPHQLAGDPTSSSLADYKICFINPSIDAVAKNHDGLPDTSIGLQEAVANCGGSIVKKVDSCTHLIASEEQYKKRGARFREAIAANLPVLTYEWLITSLGADEPVDTSSYLLDESTSRISATQEDDSGYASPHPYGTRDSSKRSLKEADVDEDDEGQDSKKPRTSPGGVRVPVDEHYQGSVGCKVYIDDNGVAYDAMLNQTDSKKNSNKFYKIQLIEKKNGEFICWTRWGRVGEYGASSALGDGSLDDALKQFDKKFKDKTGNLWLNRDAPSKAKKYTMIEINYEPEEDFQKSYPESRRGSAVSLASTKSTIRSTLPAPVEKLMNFIFDNKHIETTLKQLEYDPTRMPLGQLSQKTLLRGYQVLQELATLIGNLGYGGNNNQVQDLSNQYYTVIPHVFRRNVAPPVLNEFGMIKREINLLEALTDLRLSDEIMQTVNAGAMDERALADRQYEGLGLDEMTPLSSSEREYAELSDYLIKSAGETHYFKYEVQDIFRIERKGEAARFAQADATSSLPNLNSRRALLWHGSRSTNFAGILSQGLRIAPPEAPVSGYMFGKGVYLACVSSKSANYCFSSDSDDTGLLLLCEAELGNPVLKQKNANYNAEEDAKEQGAISTWGMGITTVKGWKDAGCVHPSLQGVEMPEVSDGPGVSDEPGLALQYDEFIVYSVAQVRLRYLFRVKMNYSY